MTDGVHFRTCPLCEATCGLEIAIAGGAIGRIRGDALDVFSKGHVCPKGPSLKGLHEDPDRLRRPLVRTGGGFEETDWATALARAEAGLRPLIRDRGPDAVALYTGNPWSHNYETIIYTPALYRALGKNRFAAASLDQRPREIVSSVHFGTRTAFPVPDIDRTHLLVLLGSDPLESNGSLATAPDWRGRLRALRARGGRLIVIDPRRSATAEVADEHLSIVPGTDAALLAGIAHVLFAERLADPGPVGAHIDGLDAVARALADFTPEAVAPMCGIDAQRIRLLARELASAPSAAVHGRLGTCLQDLATLSSWLLDVVNIATGNLDRPGGVMFSRPAALGFNTSGRPGIGPGTDYATFHSRVRGLPGAFGQLPAACLAEEIEVPGDGQVRGLITIAGNPMLSAPDGARLARAFESLEFMVSVDLYLNETTRHADVILPAPAALQRSHYDVAYYQFSVRNIANYSPPLLPLEVGAIEEWRIFLALSGMLQGAGPAPDVDATDDGMASFLVRTATADESSVVCGRDPDELMRALAPRRGPERILDLGLRIGPYGDGFGARAGLSLDRLIEQPHGIDLGPLEPRIPEMLRTPTGRIDLATPAFIADLVRLRARMEEARPALVLIGRRQIRSNNSWQHNVPSLMKGGDRCVLQVHPADAKRHGVRDGDAARVTTEAGLLIVPVEVTDAVMEGVVSLPHGFGHDLPGTRLSVAARQPGANVNLLADADRVDPLSGNPHVNGIPVAIAPAQPQEQ